MPLNVRFSTSRRRALSSWSDQPSGMAWLASRTSARCMGLSSNHDGTSALGGRMLSRLSCMSSVT
jgi:hypothetical protein